MTNNKQQTAVLGHKTSLVAQTLDSKENKQQTAVDWLFNELERIDKVYYRNTIIYTDARKEAYEKAKEMEKQQAIKLHYEYELYVMITESVIMTFGQFYKQIYGGGEQ
jgi:hypothetical protein